MTDHATVSRLAHEHGATYIVDNTFASPYICRPLKLGAHLVVESATKFLGPQRCHRGGRGRASRHRPHGREGRDRHGRGRSAALDAFLVLRDPDARHPGRPARPHRRGTGRLARTSGPRATRSVSGTAQSSAARRRRPPVPTRPGMLAVEVAGGRAAGRAVIDALALTELTASLGSVHTMVGIRHRPAAPDDRGAACWGPASRQPAARVRRARGPEDLQSDFTTALAAARDATERSSSPPSASRSRVVATPAVGCDGPGHSAVESVRAGRARSSGGC